MRIHHLAINAILLSCILGIIGCTESGVGDPFNPEGEGVPESSAGVPGFNTSEVYLPLTPQCRSLRGVCDLRGYTDDNNVLTPDEFDTTNRCYCTCRCSAPVNGRTCSCPSGFSCEDNLIELGGDGIRGGYCIRNEYQDDL